MSQPASLFREHNDEQEVEVTYIELFFDLVFVFAITQLSHHLLEHLSILGAVETLLLFAAVWWAWIYTTWTTNWLDPERAAVRLMLIAVMLGGLALAAAIPHSFDETGRLFAYAYVALQIGRTSFMIWASRGVNEARKRNFQRIAVWFLFSAPFWIAGAIAEMPWRLALWGAALAIEYAGPFSFFRTPGLGRSRREDWDISGAHMAERCALFIIIALGEGVLVTGGYYGEVEQNAATNLAFVFIFIGTAALWWIYFDIGAKRGAEMIEAAPDTGRVARNAYTYLHMIIVAGLIVTAVGDALMLKAPGDKAKLAFLLTACGGPMLFLLGNLLFKWESSERKWPPFSQMAGLMLLTFVGVVGWLAGLSSLTVGGLATAALLVTALWEWLSLHGGWQRFAPGLGRRLGGRPAADAAPPAG